MRLKRLRLICAGIGLPLVILGTTTASADYQVVSEGTATAATPATAVTDKSASTPAATDTIKRGEAKPGRLRFRSASSSACTPAKGGTSEVDIHRAEEARAGAKN